MALRLRILHCPCGAQRRLFGNIGEMHPKGAPITKIVLNDSRQVTHTQHNIGHAMRFQMAKHMLYKGAVDNWLHWLWPMQGQWAQTCPFTAYQNHCFHGPTPSV